MTDGLTGEPAKLNLPTDRDRLSNRVSRVAREQIHVDESKVPAVRDGAAALQVDVSAAYLAAVQTLLYRLTGQEYFTISVTGFRTDPHPDARLSFGGVRESIQLDCHTVGTDSFAKLATAAAAAVPAHVPAPMAVGAAGLTDLVDLAARFDAGDIRFSIATSPAALTLVGEYEADLFEPATIRRWLRASERLLIAGTTEPLREIATLAWASADDLALMERANATAMRVPRVRVHDLFAAQAHAAPDAVAVQFDDTTISYRELAQKASDLARRLRLRGIGAGALVGLSVERSIDMIVGLFGILESGAAYVPLDPTYPVDRLAFMIEDSNMRVLVTHSALRGSLTLPAGVEPLLIDQAEPSTVRAFSQARAEATPDSIAYVIYTSGSTGRPKGVLVPHRTVVNLLESVRVRLGVTASDRVLAITTLSFDIAVSEVVLPLTIGARIVLAGKETASDGAQLRRLIDERGVTFIDATPSTWRLLLDAGWTGRDGITSICTGEAMPRDLARELARMPGRLWNGYGPTETTVWSTFHEVTPPVDRILIGRPIGNTQLHVLDDRCQPVPVGVSGELYIGGAGVTAGYLGRPDLTRERFLPDPFAGADAIMYRTGDLARFLDDGNVECLGRIDDQVKIRGYRIELGEIESVLAGHEQVARAAVIAREDRPGDRRLVAYVVTRLDQAVSVNALRARVRTLLPDYMIPSVFVFLAALPLTPSGKVDRRALPAPAPGDAEERRIVDPRTPTEAVLAGLWRQALSIERLSIDDDFFLLGGHSLSASHVLARLRRDHHIDIPFRLFFEAPTIAQLAHVIDTRPQPVLRTSAVIEARPYSGPSRLSLTQERMWLLETMDPHQQVVHNLPGAWRLDGPLDAAALERSLNQLVSRHESLRTRVIVQKGQPLQEVLPAATIALPRVDLRDVALESREAAVLAFCDGEARLPQDLGAAPLLRCALICVDDQRHVLLIVPHNLIWDGWSFDVFLRELASLYGAATGVGGSPLASLPIAYRDFAEWQRDWLTGPQAAEQRAWWTAALDGQLPVLRLPSDRPRPDSQTREALHVSTTLGREKADALARIGRESGATLFTVIFAALSVVLHRITGQDDILIGVPVRARTRPETEDLLGPFLNMLVLRSRVEVSTRFVDLLTRSRSTMLDAFSHQELPIEAVDARAPILRAFFTFEDGRQRPDRMGMLRVSPVPVMSPAAAADVRLAVMETADGLSVTWTCSAELFERASADRFLQRLEVVLDAILQDPAAVVSEIPLIGEQEQTLLQAFAAPDRPAAGVNALVHELIEHHARRAPLDVAVVFGDELVEYGVLDQKARAVARALKARGVRSGSKVAIYLPRSADLVIALLGVMKAGAVCVPLDPADPPVRVSGILEHSRSGAVITDSVRRRQLPPSLLPVVCIEEATDLVAAFMTTDADCPVAPTDAACLLYACDAGELTAAALSHGALAELLASVRRELSLTHEDVALAIAPPSLDVSLIELLAPLSGSGCIVVAADDVALDSDRLTEAVGRSAATVMFASTAAWMDLLTAAGLAWPRLKAVCFGTVPGRRLAAELGARTAAAWFAHGSSPAGIWTTIHRLTERDFSDLLGKPLGHVSLRIVDADERVVPIGVSGQLLVRLQHLPVAAAPDVGSGGEWFRTDHQARWRADGEIELVASPAREVFIDGFRVDLNDVARMIRRHAAVDDAEVLVETGVLPERLVACVVPRQGGTYSVSELRRELRRTVPAAMVPRSFVEVGAIPRGEDGAALFDVLAGPRPGPAGGHVAPETATEQMLAQVWAEALGIPRVSVHDNFFALGGYSLLCFQVLDRIERRAGYRVSPRHLLLDTLRQVAAHLDGVAGPADRVEPAASRFPKSGVLQRLRRLVPGSASVLFLATKVALAAELC